VRARTLLLSLLFSAPLFAERGTVTGTVTAFPAKYAAETVVYLKDAPPPKAPRHHRVRQKGMTFLPHVLAIAVHDSVVFLNDDGVAHNVYSPDGEKYDLGVFAGGESRERVFAKPGVHTQMCSMHPEMLSYIFVGTSAYAAVVERDGRFTIPDVPAGTWKVAIWNPRLNAPDQTVTVAPRGTATVRFDLNEGTQSRL
jgi:plastocyanin